jgi:hypothetical protein
MRVAVLRLHDGIDHERKYPTTLMFAIADIASR